MKFFIIIIFSFYSLGDYLKKGINKYKKGKYKKTITFLLKHKKIKKTEDYYFYIGNSYSLINNNINAITYYDSAIILNLKNDRNFSERGLSYFLSGNSKKALEDFNKAININPKNSKYYVNRGTINYDLENYEQACLDWNKSILLDKKNINLKMIETNCN